MGKVSMLGPVYGAKALLWSFFVPGSGLSSNGATTGAIGVNAVQGSMVVPPYQDVFVTEAAIAVSTHSSAAGCIGVKLKVEGGSSGSVPRQFATPGASGTTNAATILSMVQGTTSTSWSTWATATSEASEYEGTWCPAGSTLRWVSSGTSLPGSMQINVWGFIRYIDSTRAS